MLFFKKNLKIFINNKLCEKIKIRTIYIFLIIQIKINLTLMKDRTIDYFE